MQKKTVTCILFVYALLYAGDCEFTIARMQYDGGGDRYANTSSLPSLIKAVRERTAVPICNTLVTVKVMDDTVFRYPFIYMTGHGNVRFTGAGSGNFN